MTSSREDYTKQLWRGFVCGASLNIIPAIAAFRNIGQGSSHGEHRPMEILGTVAGVALTLAILATLGFVGLIGVNGVWYGATIAVIGLALDFGATLSRNYPQAKNQNHENS